MNFLALFVALFTFTTATPTVQFEVPSTIQNGVKLPINLHFSESVGAGEVSEVRTVLFVPGKRSPKPFNNITHNNFVVREDGSVETLATYSIPTKNYLLGYSVLVSYSDEEKLWIDSELVDVKIVDASPNFVKLLLASGLVLAFFYGFELLLYKLAAPGYWESSLPKYLHFILPKSQ